MENISIKSIAIICNGEFDNAIVSGGYLNNIDYIIAADGGANNCYNCNITPNIIIGDLDSLNTDIQNYYKKLEKD